MSLSLHQSRRAWTTFALFPLAWLLLLGMTLHVRYRDPFGPSLAHPGYGENLPGDVASNMIWGACETIVLLVILWPWRPQSIRARLLIALILYVPWTLLLMTVFMHGGSITATLVVWRLGLILLLIVTSLVLALRSDFRREPAG